MKQLIQNYRTGDLSLREVPAPMTKENHILVRTLASAVSLGTEKSIVDFSKKNLLRKALARPDLVKQVRNRAKKDGLFSTYRQAMSRLDDVLPMGYSSSGEVLEIGGESSRFNIGDIVALNGTGYASHSEFSVAPYNLASKVPENVHYEHAAFGAIGGIALEGIRNTEATVGSSIAVFGMGLVGLLTAQILKSYGFTIIGVDPEQAKIDLAYELGVEVALKPDDDLPGLVNSCTDGSGVDASIICALADSAQPIEQSATICRQRGRIVMVGVTDMTLDRRVFYEKELTFVVSKSTGAGKGDPGYELDGVDYPAGLVRWTQERNVSEFLRLISNDLIQIEPLISNRVSIEESAAFYREFLDSPPKDMVGTIIQYADEPSSERTIHIKKKTVKECSGSLSIGLIGAGQFGKNVLYPVLEKEKRVTLKALATSSGISANEAGQKLGVDYVSTDYQQILDDSAIDAVFVTTRHASHADIVVEALNKGKSVFVEKPLAAEEEDLQAITEAYNSSEAEVMTGFCRRYSPAMAEMRLHLKDWGGPKIIHYRINAGHIPPEHWVQREPGGRIVGEVCHFIDLISALADSQPVEISSARVSGDGDLSQADNIAIAMKMADGSLGNIIYSSMGNKSFAREYIEVHGSESVLINNDFREVIRYGESGKDRKKWTRRDLGYSSEISRFVDLLSGNVESTFASDVASTSATFAALRAAKNKQWVPIERLL